MVTNTLLFDRVGPFIDSTRCILIFEVDITIHTDEQRRVSRKCYLDRSDWIGLPVYQDVYLVVGVISSINTIMMIDEKTTGLDTKDTSIREGDSILLPRGIVAQMRESVRNYEQ